jgi:exonuclease III
VHNFNISLPLIDRSSRQKIDKENSELNDNIAQMELTDIHRIFHSTATQFAFFSAAHGTFSKIDHILGYETNINKYMKIEITLCTSSDHNEIKQEINTQRNNRELSNIWRLKNTVLND